MSLIELKNVKYSYSQEFQILKGVSFKFIKALLTHIEQFTIELN